MNVDKRPLCPQCGCPARKVKMTANVICDLEMDGTAGKVRHAGTPVGKVTYICGGEHKWECVETEHKTLDE